MAGVLRRSPVLAVLAAAALAGCVDTSSPREDGLFWWPATGPDVPAYPTITALTPSSATAGDPAFVLTVTGTGFVDGAQVTWSGTSRPTAFVSSTTLRASISAVDVASSGWAYVAVTNPGGATSGSLSFQIASNTLSITSLTPSEATAGDPGFVLTVTGRRFVDGSVVSWNSTPRPTTFVSSTTLRAAIAAADVATGGWVTVDVQSPGDGAFAHAQLTVKNPVPVITWLSPAVAALGGADLALTVSGGPFVGGSYVTWNDGWCDTTFVSSTALRATVPSSRLATAGTAAVRVHAPGPGGGDSAPVSLPIRRPSPTVAAMSPAAAAPGSPRFTLTVTGRGFVPDTTVRWNGTPRATTVVSSTVLHASIDATDVASPGTAAVSVYSAPPDGGTASAGTFVVEPTLAATQAVAYQLDPAHAGRIDLGAPPSFPADPAWVATVAGDVTYPLVAGGKVFVVAQGASTAELVALDLATGAVAWGPVTASGTTWRIASHAFDRGRVFTIDFDGVLRAFDAATGAAAWTVDLPWQYAFTAPPTALGGVVYVGGAGSGGTVYAVAEDDGRILWTHPVANGDDSGPAVGLDGVYVSYPCQVYKLDLLTGAPIWHWSTGCSGGGGATIALGHGKVHVRDWVRDPVGIVLDAFDATFLGTFGAGRTMVPIPALGGDATFFLTSGLLEARDLAGALRWSFRVDAPPTSGTLGAPAIVLGDAVVAGASTGAVYALDAATGALRWTGDAGASIAGGDTGALAAGEGYLVVPAGRRIVAWKLVP
jgi:outer membrane protein assembly factor BamB